jgi:hypothetical protein
MLTSPRLSDPFTPEPFIHKGRGSTPSPATPHRLLRESLRGDGEPQMREALSRREGASQARPEQQEGVIDVAAGGCVSLK